MRLIGIVFITIWMRNFNKERLKQLIIQRKITVIGLLTVWQNSILVIWIQRLRK